MSNNRDDSDLGPAAGVSEDEFARLIEQSSLGTAGARRLKGRVSDEQVRKVRRRMSEGSEGLLSTQSAKSGAAGYIVVLRGRSSARFKQAEGVSVTFGDAGVTDQVVKARIRTRWVDEGFESAVPRELWIDARLYGDSLDAACSAASGVAHLLTLLATFCANVTGDVPEVHLAYREKPHDSRREFVEVFLPDETSTPREGRSVDVNEYMEVFNAVNSSGQQKRIVRALNQYQIALRYWYLGGEWLALTHLYMAVETLTKVALRHECHKLGIGEAELARRNNIDPDDPERPRWRPALEAWARADLIFEGDAVTYSAARGSSDGVEHGFMEFSEINQYALAATLSTFGYVRRAILRFLELPEESELGQRSPLDVGSLRRMVRGHFVGDADDPAPAGSEYPHLEWNSSLKSFKQVGDKLVFTPREAITVQCAEGMGFQGQAFEVRGRSQTGGLQMEEETAVQSDTDPTPTDRLDKAWDLVRRVQAVVSLPRTGVSAGPERIAFTIFAEHVAIFEGAANLVARRRPVEAIILVEKGIESTCRLQLMSDQDSGMGWMLRAQMDATLGALTMADDAQSAPIATRVEHINATAREHAIEIPQEPWPLSQAPYWADDEDGMRVISEICRADDLATELHTDRSTEGEAVVRTEVDNPELSVSVLGTAMHSLLESREAAFTILSLAKADVSDLIEEIRSLVPEESSSKSA